MNTKVFAAVLVIALLTGCSANHAPPPTPASWSSSLSSVQPPQGAGESSSGEEGWIGDDETTPATGEVDAHPHDPPSDQELEAAVTTANEVIVGWLTADQTQRRDTLGGVAAEALIDAFDDPRFTPVAHRQHGPTHVMEADPMEIVTRHRLVTGDIVDVTLIPEPDAPHGWITIAITGH